MTIAGAWCLPRRAPVSGKAPAGGGASVLDQSVIKDQSGLLRKHASRVFAATQRRHGGSDRIAMHPGARPAACRRAGTPGRNALAGQGGNGRPHMRHPARHAPEFPERSARIAWTGLLSTDIRAAGRRRAGLSVRPKTNMWPARTAPRAGIPGLPDSVGTPDAQFEEAMH